MKGTPSGPEKRQQTFFFHYLSQRQISTEVLKRRKHRCMFNTAFVFLGLTCILPLLSGRKLHSYGTSSHSELLCYSSRVFEMYLSEVKVCVCSPLSGFFYLVQIVLLRPTIAPTNRDTSKASKNDTTNFPLHVSAAKLP